MAAIESLVFVNKSIVGPTSVVAGSSLLPQTTLQATGTTTLIGNVFVQGGALYPPGPMTSASTALSGYAYGNGTYIASGTELNAFGPNPWTVFDASISTYIETPNSYSSSSPFAYSNTSPYAFSNTIADGSTTYNGVWLQLQLPSAIILEYYSLVSSPGGVNRSPGTWRVFGSNDGTTWLTIDSQSSITTWASPQVFKTFYLSPLPTAYSWFRLSVQNLGANGSILNVGQWNLYGKPPVPAMSILGGDVTIASGGGLNVGPGTLGSNVVIFSNVSGGSNVFVMDSIGRIGINTTTPTSTLHVAGNIFASNALTTTNVFAATEVLTGTTGQTTLNVTGNVTVSNALTTTNVFAVTEVLTGTAGQTTLNVTGNVTVSNALTTTNVFAATEVLTGTTGQTTLNVTGNIYASNALTTSNIFAAGFTSNVSNTNFFYSTLTVPFVYSTTLNVASTANVLTASIQGSIGQTSLNVTGNVYVSNALTTTNVYMLSGLTSATPAATKGALEFNGTGGVFYTTPQLIRGISPSHHFYMQNADVAFGTTTSAAASALFPAVTTGITLQTGKYYLRSSFVVTVENAAAGTTTLSTIFAGTATYTMFINSQNTSVATAPGTLISSAVVNLMYNSTKTITAISTSTVGGVTSYYTTLEGFIDVSVAGTFLPQIAFTNSGAAGLVVATPGVRNGSFMYLEPLGPTNAIVNVGAWA